MWATSEKALNTSLRNLGCLVCVKRGNSKFLSKRISWKSRLHTLAGHHSQAQPLLKTAHSQNLEADDSHSTWQTLLDPLELSLYLTLKHKIRI